MNKEDDKVKDTENTGKAVRAERPRLKPTAAFYGLICVILGVIDLIKPEKMLNIIAYALGISAIVCGLVFVIIYLVRDIRFNLESNDFLNGLIAIIIGTVIIVKWNEFMTLVPIVLGVLIMISGCIKLQDAIDLRKLNNPVFPVMIILAVVFIAFGAVLVANPFKSEIILMRLIGVSLIISGMTDLFASVYFDAVRRSLKPDVIETTYTETESETK